MIAVAAHADEMKKKSPIDNLVGMSGTAAMDRYSGQRERDAEENRDNRDKGLRTAFDIGTC